MTDRIFRLLSRHQRLDDRLQSELSRSRPDIIRLLRLQRLKLAVKERLNHVFGGPLAPLPAF